MADKRRYSFIEVKRSKGGVRSARIALAALACFAVCVAVSFAMKGSAGPYIGALSFSGMLLSLYGFYVGMRSFEEKEVSPTWSVIGAIASGVVAVGYLTLFLTGIG